MATSILLQHLDEVRNGLMALSAGKRFVFGAACTEREWRGFQTAVHGKVPDERALLRSALDAVWSWLCGQGSRPMLAQQCEQAIVEEVGAYKERVVFGVSNNIFGLASIVEQDQPQHSYQCAQCNVELVRSWLYEQMALSYSDDTEDKIAKHPLMQREFECQLDDLALVRALDSSLAGRILLEKYQGYDLFDGSFSG